jgi:hypothetical protein
MKRWVLKLRIVLWIVLAGIVGWLLYMAVVPSGKISYVYDFKRSNYFIGKLSPKERVKPVNNGSQVVVGDLVYFSLRTPRKFDKAVLTLKYKTVETRHAVETRHGASLPIIEAGILADKTIWRYDLKPIENKIIDRLSLAWDMIEENGVILLQREKKYKTINEFLNNVPPRDEIALYNYDLKTNFILKDYAPMELSSGYPELSSEINYPLRGDWQFYTYIKDEDLDFTFNFQDLNKNKDSDEIDLYLYYNNQLIDSRHLNDDGISETGGKITNRGEIKLKLTNLPEGVYKIELRANDDIITKNIITKQKKLAFINKLWLARGNNSQIILYTDSREIKAQTINPGSLQTIKVSDSELVIDETYKQFSVDVEADATELSSVASIALEKDDVILAGDGVFSFKEDSLINPKLKKVDANLDVDRGGVNYILANYRIPQDEGEWKVARAEFDLTKAYSEDGKYSFLISIPGLRADDEIDDSIEIGGIRVDLEGRSLVEKLKEMLSNK